MFSKKNFFLKLIFSTADDDELTFDPGDIIEEIEFVSNFRVFVSKGSLSIRDFKYPEIFIRSLNVYEILYS